MTVDPLDTCFSGLLSFTAWWHEGVWKHASHGRSQRCLHRRTSLHNKDGQVPSNHGGPTWLSPRIWQGLHVVWSLTSPSGLHFHATHLPPAQEALLSSSKFINWLLRPFSPWEDRNSNQGFK